MTANYTTGNGFYGASSYVQNKKEAELLHTNNLFGDTPKQISKEMREVASSNRTKKPVLHASFSFHPSEKINNAKAITAVESALSNVGITKDNYQYTIVKHNDTKHPHYHAVVNRVGLDLKAHNDYYLSNRLMASCDKVEKDMNLRRTEGRTVVWDDKSKLNFKIDKKEIEKPKKIRHTKNKTEFWNNDAIKVSYEKALSESKNIDELKSNLKKEDIEIDIKTNKNGVYGVSFRYDNQAVKGSKLGIKAKELNTAFEKKQTQQKATVPDTKTLIDNGIKEYNNVQSQYLSQRQNYSAMLEEHKENLINSGKSDVNQIAEKYGFNKAEYLSDLRLVNQKVIESKKEVEKVRNTKENNYKTLMETPYKTSGMLTFGDKKREIESFNEDLKYKQESAKKELQYFNENGHFHELRNNLNSKVLDIRSERDKQMREAVKIQQKNVLSKGLNNGVDIDKVIKDRERAQKEQDRERNISRNKGGFSR